MAPLLASFFVSLPSFASTEGVLLIADGVRGA